MTINNFATYIGYFLGIIIILITAQICRAPLKILFKLLINSALGCVFLSVLNTIFSFCNFYIAINPITAMYIGILGIPGAVAVIIIRLII